MNYKRAIGAIVLKCHGDRLYASRLKCLLRVTDYIIITKEGMQDDNYDDEFCCNWNLKIFMDLLRLDENLLNYTRKRRRNKLYYGRLRFCPKDSQM